MTPCQLIVQRKGEITVTVHKDGYKDYSTVLVSAVEGGSLGLGTVANLLTIPIINDIVDYKTGANYAHKPNPLLVNLIPVTAGPDEKPAEPAKTVTPPPSPDKTAGK